MATETTKRNSQQEFWYISTDYSRWTTNIWGCRNISDSKIDQSLDDGVIEKKNNNQNNKLLSSILFFVVIYIVVQLQPQQVIQANLNRHKQQLINVDDYD